MMIDLLVNTNLLLDILVYVIILHQLGLIQNTLMENLNLEMLLFHLPSKIDWFKMCMF